MSTETLAKPLVFGCAMWANNEPAQSSAAMSHARLRFVTTPESLGHWKVSYDPDRDTDLRD